jgi:hypothetical protein
MSLDRKDEDHSYFISMGGIDDGTGEEVVVSRAAFMLHSHGIVNSVQDGTLSFVSDDYLNAISVETTITAAELCTAGLWRRVDGGYELVEREPMDMVVEQNRGMDEAHEFCAMTGGHGPGDENRDYCRKCTAPIA